MALKLFVLGSVTDAGSRGKANEDIAGSAPGSAWVLDGATGLGADDLIRGQSAAAWLVGAYQRRLLAAGEHRAFAARRASSGRRSLFGRVIAEVKAEFEAKRRRAPKHRYEEPSAGMVFVRLRSRGLEWAGLGDCRAVLRTAGRTTVTHGSPVLQELDRKALEQMAAFRMRANQTDGREPPHSELLAAVTPLLRENRSRLNTEGGYWVLGTDPVAARKLDLGRIELAEERYPLQGLLVSDGFYRLVDTFGDFDDGQLLDAALRPGGLGTLLSKLRSREDKDPECRSPLRLKPRDDATALLFEVAPG